MCIYIYIYIYIYMFKLARSARVEQGPQRLQRPHGLRSRSRQGKRGHHRRWIVTPSERELRCQHRDGVRRRELPAHTDPGEWNQLTAGADSGSKCRAGAYFLKDGLKFNIFAVYDKIHRQFLQRNSNTNNRNIVQQTLQHLVPSLYIENLECIYTYIHIHIYIYVCVCVDTRICSRIVVQSNIV